MARILMSGATGLIGTELSQRLRLRGDEVLRLVRRDSRHWSEVNWERIPPNLGVDAVIHLAGEPVVGLWTKGKKGRIRESRVAYTRKLTDQLLAMEPKPKALICASAVGFYGSRGDEVLTEQSGPGEGFLAEACVAWESAAAPARDAGVRVAHLRIGIVLTLKGGALKSMLLPFKLGLGSRLGSGHQWIPWITLDDLAAAFLFVLDNPQLAAPFNACAPNPVTNADFTRELARALHRPTFLPIPEFALKLAPGGMAEEMFLSSARAVPGRLLKAGFRFRSEHLAEALKKLLTTESTESHGGINK